MTKYGEIFIASQQTLDGVTYCRPLIRTTVRKTSLTRARRICTIVKNRQQKLKHLSELKQNLKIYHYPDTIITNGVKKALEIP